MAFISTLVMTVLTITTLWFTTPVNAEIFAKFEGCNGGVSTPNFVGTSAISTFFHDFTRFIDDGDVGELEVNPVGLVKTTDGCTSTLLGSVLAGNTISEVVISIALPTEPSQNLEAQSIVQLKNARISQFATTSEEGGALLENIELVFEEICFCTREPGGMLNCQGIQLSSGTAAMCSEPKTGN